MEWFGTLIGRAVLAGLILGAGWVLGAILSFAITRIKWLGGLIPDTIHLPRFFFPSVYLILYSMLAWLALPLFHFSPVANARAEHILNVALIIGSIWFLIRGLYLFRDIVYARFSLVSDDNLSQRRIRTQMQYVVNVAAVFLLVVGVAAVLLTFPGARRVGASLIASAGLASVIIGFAAQKSLSNLVAGFQIAFTQPIRIDDVVIVENEWGRVEEITLTYVVLNIWDLRRLVVPITYFVERPFQNWTRTSAELLGTVELHTDFSIPVDMLRAELNRVVRSHKLWNQKVCVLQVSHSTDRTMVLRCLVSANDAGRLFDLRCDVREALITFIQKKFPGGLPRIRAEWQHLPQLSSV